MRGPAASGAVLCAGRLYCDLVFTGAPQMPAPGTETFAEGLSLHAGGGAFITAAALSALGWDAGLAAVLPAAPFDAVVRGDIAAFRIDTSQCTSAPAKAAPQLTVAIVQGGDRAFLSHKAGVAMPPLSLDPRRVQHLHIGELRSLLECPEALAQAKAAGLTVSVDCGWDETLLADGAALQEILEQVDLFLPNEVEFARLTGSGLRAEALPHVVVKCGAQGARSLRGGAWTKAPAQPCDVVDSTGAGDAFNGGFLSAWLLGADLDTCLAEGNRCGAAAVAHAGGTAGLAHLSRDLNVARLGAAQ